MPVTLLRQRKPLEIQFLRFKIIGAPTKFKNWPGSLFLELAACHQKPNPSHETVPLRQ
jgi:hypothetical protein